MYKVLLISDTHGLHGYIDIEQMPQADCIIHCGDFSNQGRPSELLDFFAWFDSLPFTRKIIMPGNHDLMFETDLAQAKKLLSNFPGIECYIDDSAIIAGLEFYFYPWTPKFYDWAFMKERESDELREKVNQIPDSAHVLISHGPPIGILDYTRGGKLAGCELLRAKTAKMPHLKVCVFGHIHEGHGNCTVGGVTYLNAALLEPNHARLRSPYQTLVLE